jgi:acyl-CoA oxidase
VKRAGLRMQRGVERGMSPKASWDEHSQLELVDAATAHGYNIILKYNYGKICELCRDERLKEVLTDLLRLYALERISEYSLSFFETKVLSATSLKTYRSLREKLLAKIRPNALNIVEAFSYSDNTLHTALGRQEGRAY